MPSACVSELPSCDLTVACAGLRSLRTAIMVLLAVAAQAGIGATLWPTTSWSELSGQLTFTPSWSPLVFFAAMESGPTELPSTLGTADNI